MTPSFLNHLPYWLIFGAMLLLGGIVLWGIYWAAKNGQFRNLEKGSTVIFDADEKPGELTDKFPGKKKAKPASKS